MAYLKANVAVTKRSDTSAKITNYKICFETLLCYQELQTQYQVRLRRPVKTSKSSRGRSEFALEIYEV